MHGYIVRPRQHKSTLCHLSSLWRQWNILPYKGQTLPAAHRSLSQYQAVNENTLRQVQFAVISASTTSAQNSTHLLEAGGVALRRRELERGAEHLDGSPHSSEASLAQFCNKGFAQVLLSD